MYLKNIISSLIPNNLLRFWSLFRSEQILKKLKKNNKILNVGDLDKYEITLTCIPENTWNMTLFEVAIICLFSKLINAINVFEIGTFDGRTALNLACCLPQNGKVTTINLPKDHLGGNEKICSQGVGYRYKSRREAERIEQLIGDSMTFEIDSFKNKYDIVIIDGDHTEKYVNNDTQLALKLLKKRKHSLIVWHDIDRPEIYKALNEIERTMDFKYHYIAHTRIGLAFPFAGDEIPIKFSSTTANPRT
ncbi:MAG: class I SAM-dependent methyltransferase [Pseudomonadota bacterium]